MPGPIFNPIAAACRPRPMLALTWAIALPPPFAARGSQNRFRSDSDFRMRIVGISSSSRTTTASEQGGGAAATADRDDDPSLLLPPGTHRYASTLKKASSCHFHCSRACNAHREAPFSGCLSVNSGNKISSTPMHAMDPCIQDPCRKKILG